MIALPSGALLLAFDDDARLRTPLALSMSRDGGDTWCGTQITKPAHAAGARNVVRRRWRFVLQYQYDFSIIIYNGIEMS